MATRATKSAKDSQKGRQADPDRLHELIRGVVALSTPIDSAMPAPEGTRGCERILADVEIDGSRYLLVQVSVGERKNSSLSPREMEIVRMVAQGHPNKIIAVVLNISSWTVCTHLRRIFAKLGVSSRAAMVARLLEASGPLESGLYIREPAFPATQRRPVESHAGRDRSGIADCAVAVEKSKIRRAGGDTPCNPKVPA